MRRLQDDDAISRWPFATIALVTLIALSFLWQQTLDPDARRQVLDILGFIPGRLFGKPELPAAAETINVSTTLLASALVHGGWIHVVTNVVFLALFGPRVEDGIGPVRLLVLFVLAHSVSAFAEALPAPHSLQPIFGTSGSVSAILASFLMLSPHGRLKLMPSAWMENAPRIPAVPAMGVYFIGQTAAAVLSPVADAGLAVWGPVAGFIAGFVLLWLIQPPRIVPWD